MGKRGPAPTPTKQLKLRGSQLLPKRRGEVEAPTAIPTPPDILTGEGLTEWKSITVELEKMGLITVIDKALIVSYCEAWAEFIEAWHVIKKEGRVYLSDKGNMIQSPWVGIKNKAIERIHRMAQNFGLSPSARAGLAVQANEKLSDPLSELLKRRSG